MVALEVLGYTELTELLPRITEVEQDPLERRRPLLVSLKTMPGYLCMSLHLAQSFQWLVNYGVQARMIARH